MWQLMPTIEIHKNIQTMPCGEMPHYRRNYTFGEMSFWTLSFGEMPHLAIIATFDRNATFVQNATFGE